MAPSKKTVSFTTPEGASAFSSLMFSMAARPRWFRVEYGSLSMRSWDLGVGCPIADGLSTPYQVETRLRATL